MGALQGQNLLVDNFESNVNRWGAWGMAANVIVKNPKKSGINTSENVYKLEKAEKTCGIHYDNEKQGNLNIPVPKTGNAAAGQYRYLHFKLLREQGGNASIVVKLNPTPYLTKENWISSSSEWQYIVIDLQEKNDYSENDLGGPYHKVEIEPNKNGETTTLYLDDIFLSPSNNHITTNLRSTEGFDSPIRILREEGGKTLCQVSKHGGALKLEVYNLQGKLLQVVSEGVISEGIYELPSCGYGVQLLKVTSKDDSYCLKF